MTNEEVVKLQEGDIVCTTRANATVACKVENIRLLEDGFGNIYILKLRRTGKTRGGAKYPSFYTDYSRAYVVSRFDPLSANVYADWLDDNGEPQAAAKLRTAFPLPETPS